MDSKKELKRIESLIARGYREGFCDIDGNSVKDSGGKFIAKPRKKGRVTFHKVYPREYKTV